MTDKAALASEKHLTPPAGFAVPSQRMPMPAFRLQDVSGTAVQSSDLVGKVVTHLHQRDALRAEGS